MADRTFAASVTGMKPESDVYLVFPEPSWSRSDDERGAPEGAPARTAAKRSSTEGTSGACLDTENDIPVPESPGIGASYTWWSRIRHILGHMVTPQHNRNLARVTLTLDPVDVELLDRLGKLEGLNRSQEMRSIMSQFRPMLRATVEAFEQALEQREKFGEVAASASIARLQEMLPEVERMQDSYLGAMARIEGLAAAHGARDDNEDPRPSNHGGHTPTPPASEDL